MSAQRTPGLLTVKRGQFGSSVFVLYGPDGFPIAQTISNSTPEGMERARRGEHEANATWLAHCWNEHDALHAARAALLTVARDCEAALARYDTLPAGKAKALRKALAAAIAKATGASACAKPIDAQIQNPADTKLQALGAELVALMVEDYGFVKVHQNGGWTLLRATRLPRAHRKLPPVPECSRATPQGSPETPPVPKIGGPDGRS